MAQKVTFLLATVFANNQQKVEWSYVVMLTAIGKI